MYMYTQFTCVHTIFFRCSPFLCSNVVKKSVNRVWLAKKDNKNQKNKNQFCIYYNRFGKHNLYIYKYTYVLISLLPSSLSLSVSDTCTWCTCTYLQVVVTEVINVHLLMIQNMQLYVTSKKNIHVMSCILLLNWVLSTCTCTCTSTQCFPQSALSVLFNAVQRDREATPTKI